jgi:[ribosomal protein S18]-alanine N-acetyltransferase
MAEPDITLEPLVHSHLDDVLEIERELFPAPWTEAMFRQEVEEKWLSRSFVALLDGNIVGYVISWFLRGEVHVLNLAVTKAHQRQGIARRMLATVLDVAKDEACHLVTLEVRVSNDPAKFLYMSMGFAPVGIRRRYYHDNDEDALVMTKRLRGQS